MSISNSISSAVFILKKSSGLTSFLRGQRLPPIVQQTILLHHIFSPKKSLFPASGPGVGTFDCQMIGVTVFCLEKKTKKLQGFSRGFSVCLELKYRYSRSAPLPFPGRWFLGNDQKEQILRIFPVQYPRPPKSGLS